MTGSTPRFRRPAMLDPRMADEIPGAPDPALVSQLAHDTASAIVLRGRSSADPEVVDRLLRLVETEGLDVVAAMWADSPANTLPGTLWRLYLLREWLRRDPETVAARYTLGTTRAEVQDAVAGLAMPPQPSDVRELADAILAGVYTGDLGVALERASALCRVLATGAALDADWVEEGDQDLASQITRRASSLQSTAEDLAAAAGLWRAGRLD